MEYNVPSIYLEISPSMRHRDYTAQAWALECPDVKNYKWRPVTEPGVWRWGGTRKSGLTGGLSQAPYALVCKFGLITRPIFSNSGGVRTPQTPPWLRHWWRLNRVCHRMLYCCTHMTTVGVKGLLITEEVYWFNTFEIRHNSAVLTMWIGQTTGCWLAHCTSHHEEKEIRHPTVFVQRCTTPLTNPQSQAFIQHKIDHSLWYAVVRRRDSAVETSNSVWLVDVTYQPVRWHSFPPTTTVSHFTSWPRVNPLMPTAIKHSVPDRVKPSFVIFDIRALWRSAVSVTVPGCQKLQMTA